MIFFERQKVMLCTATVPDMVNELKEMDGRVFRVEKYVKGRYYYLQGCVSKAGVPFAILPDWIVPTGGSF